MFQLQFMLILPTSILVKL